MSSPISWRPNLLVIDDNDAIRAVLGAALRPEAFDVRLAAGGAEGVALYRAGPADLVLLDVWMPVLDGPSTLAALKVLDPAVRCCFLTGHADPLLAARLLAQGAPEVLFKPFRLDELAGTARRLLAAGRTAPAIG
jgi:DNA-binding NtrC family response regulator